MSSQLPIILAICHKWIWVNVTSNGNVICLYISPTYAFMCKESHLMDWMFNVIAHVQRNVCTSFANLLKIGLKAQLQYRWRNFSSTSSTGCSVVGIFSVHRTSSCTWTSTSTTLSLKQTAPSLQWVIHTRHLALGLLQFQHSAKLNYHFCVKGTQIKSPALFYAVHRWHA